jgi:hypothetical protein
MTRPARPNCLNAWMTMTDARRRSNLAWEWLRESWARRHSRPLAPEAGDSIAGRISRGQIGPSIRLLPRSWQRLESLRRARQTDQVRSLGPYRRREAFLPKSQWGTKRIWRATRGLQKSIRQRRLRVDSRSDTSSSQHSDLAGARGQVTLEERNGSIGMSGAEMTNDHCGGGKYETCA